MLRMIVSVLVFFYVRLTEAEINSELSVDEPCKYIDTVNISSGFLDKNGDFHHDGILYTKGSFAEYDYIIKNNSERIAVDPHIRGCICMYKTCIMICCREEENSCKKPEKLNIFTETGDEDKIDLRLNNYGILTKVPCKDMYILVPMEYDMDRWYFSNGSVHVLEENKSINYNNFCFAMTEKDGKMTGDLAVSVCFNEQQEDLRTSLYPYGMIFSMPFLFITFCIYGFFSELRNLHGKSLMCFVLGLMIMYTFLIIVQLETSSFLPEGFACVFCGYMIYIGILLSFFWMNVMCYDIWSTFSETRVRVNDCQRFIFYCIYGFGVPFLMAAVAMILDSTNLIPKAYRPMIGTEKCWIQGNRISEAIYIYLPISIILVINIVLCSITAFKIYRAQQRTSTVRSKRQNAEKERFFLYLRLFIVMGATWTMESISWIVDTPYFFYFTDFLNCLQGFIIFILFVWKPKVKELICQRISPNKYISGVTLRS